MAIMSSDPRRELVIRGRQGWARCFWFIRQKTVRCIAQVAGGTGALPTLSGRRGSLCDIFGPRWEPPQSSDSRLSVWGAGRGKELGA